MGKGFLNCCGGNGFINDVSRQDQGFRAGGFDFLGQRFQPVCTAGGDGYGRTSLGQGDGGGFADAR